MNGATGPHPRIERLPHFAVLIRAQTMRGAACRQALDELLARGLWLPREQMESATERAKEGA